MSRFSKSAALAVLCLTPVTALGAAGAAGAAEHLTASMTGNSEVPHGDRDGRGSAHITTDSGRGRICYRIKLSKVGTVNAGHIHKGSAGKAGPIVVAFLAKPTRRPTGCVNGVSKSLMRDIERHPGRYYVNVHSKSYPAGAVRGQLR